MDRPTNLRFLVGGGYPGRAPRCLRRPGHPPAPSRVVLSRPRSPVPRWPCAAGKQPAPPGRAASAASAGARDGAPERLPPPPSLRRPPPAAFPPPAPGGARGAAIVGMLRHALLDNQVIFADGHRRRVTQRESLAVAQEAAVRIGLGTARQPAFAQPLQAARDFIRSPLQRRHLLRAQRLARRFIARLRVALFLPATNLPPDLPPLGPHTIRRRQPIP